MATMKSITARGTRLEQLKQLAKVLASGIDACEDCRALQKCLLLNLLFVHSAASSASGCASAKTVGTA